MKRKTIYLTAPHQVELHEESLPALGTDGVLVETICSAISAGTEFLVYRGQFPNHIDAQDNVSSNLKYPVATRWRFGNRRTAWNGNWRSTRWSPRPK